MAKLLAMDNNADEIARKKAQFEKMVSSMDEGSGASVLLVDDNEFARITIVAMLNDLYKVKCDEAEDGVQAVAKYKANMTSKSASDRYKIIITDLKMPNMDGFEEFKAIKELEK